MDANGAPIIGSLEFYQTGTSTKITTYSDAARSAANTNPINADSNGRFGAIFFSPTDLETGVKVVYYDAADGAGGTGSIVYTDDPYGKDEADSTLSASAVAEALNVYTLQYRGYGGISFTSSITSGVVYFNTQDHDTIDGVVATVANSGTNGFTITADRDLLLNISFSVKLKADSSTGSAGFLEGRISLNTTGDTVAADSVEMLAADKERSDGNSDPLSINVAASVRMTDGDVVKCHVLSDDVDRGNTDPAHSSFTPIWVVRASAIPCA